MAKDKNSGLKSAFELSMERLASKGDGLTSLSDDQKKALANLANKTKSSIAQVEIMFTKSIASANAAGDAEKVSTLEGEMRAEIAKLKQKDEAERGRIRAGH